MSTPLSTSELDEYLSAFRHLQCWRFGRYLGSMLTLDFGRQIDVETHDSTVVAEGELLIGIRNVFWKAFADDGRTLTSADEVDDELFKIDLVPLAVGASIVSVSSTHDGRWINFRFDNGFTLAIDTTNMWQSGGDLFEIKIPDGRIVVLDEEGVLQILEEVEPLRAERWQSRLI